jgi:hypothetical protein
MASGKVNYAFPLNKDINHNSENTKITSLDTLPIGSWGRAYFDSTVSPTGSNITLNYLKFGANNTFCSIIVVTHNSLSYVYVIHRSDSGWTEWRRIPTEAIS